MTTVVAMSPEGGQKFPRGLHDVYWGITPPFQEPSGSAFDPQLVRHPRAKGTSDYGPILWRDLHLAHVLQCQITHVLNHHTLGQQCYVPGQYVRILRSHDCAGRFTNEFGKCDLV